MQQIAEEQRRLARSFFRRRGVWTSRFPARIAGCGPGRFYVLLVWAWPRSKNLLNNLVMMMIVCVIRTGGGGLISTCPILDLESRNAGEMPDIVGDQCGAQRERVSSNHLVEVADAASFGRERRAQSAMRIGGTRIPSHSPRDG